MKLLLIMLMSFLFIGCNSKLKQLELEVEYLENLIEYSKTLPIDSIGRKIEYYSNMFSLDSKLVRAVIKQESNFNPLAISSASAKGLMQVTENSKDLFSIFFYQKEFDLFNEDDNLKIGCYILKNNIEIYGLELGLACYNGGPRVVKQYALGLGPKETLNYVPKVLKYYKM